RVRSSGGAIATSDSRLATSDFLVLLNLVQRLLDEPLVVLARHVTLQNLRGNLHRQFDGLAANLLQRPRRFQLNLLSGIADDAFGFGARLLAHLFAKPFGISAAGGDD